MILDFGFLRITRSKVHAQLAIVSLSKTKNGLVLLNLYLTATYIYICVYLCRLTNLSYKHTKIDKNIPLYIHIM